MKVVLTKREVKALVSLLDEIYSSRDYRTDGIVRYNAKTQAHLISIKLLKQYEQ